MPSTQLIPYWLLLVSDSGYPGSHGGVAVSHLRHDSSVTNELAEHAALTTS